MSVRAMSAVFAVGGVTASEKLVLLALANCADEQMCCWPSQSRLARDTALSERTVRSVLAALEKRGLVSRRERRRDDGSRASDLITLDLDAVSAPPETESAPAETRAAGVGRPLPGGGAMASGLTTFEPSGEPSGEPSKAPPPERAAPPQELGPNALAWSRGVALLTTAGRMPQARARSLFGRLLRGPPPLEARELLAAIASAEANGTQDPQAYLSRAARAVAQRRGPASGPATATWDEATWRRACLNFRNEGAWSAEMGPEPGRPGCIVPEPVLVEFGWAG